MSQIQGFGSSGGGSGTVTSLAAGTGITLTPSPITNSGTIALSIPVSIADGGTNATTFAHTNGVVIYNGTRLIDTLVGTAGQVLTSNAPNAPTFQAIPPSGIITINGDSGSVTGDPVVFNALSQAGSSVSFDGSGSTMSFNTTDLNSNTMIGLGTGNNLITGTQNTGLGSGVLASLGNGGSNTAIGSNAMNNVAANVSNNTAIGQNAMAILGTSSQNNTGVGVNVLQAANAIEVNFNTAIGVNAGFSINTTGSNGNILIGGDTFFSCNPSIANVGLGYGAAISCTSGSYNIAIGSGIGDASNAAGSAWNGAESSNICIGNVGVSGDSNTIRIGTTGSGNTQQNSAYIAGISGINVGSTANVVSISTGTNQLGTTAITAGAGISVTPGANTITIASAINPAKPAFNAYTSATVNNVTGNGTVYTVLFNTELFDQGSNYNTGTGQFTAPSTGVYSFESAVNMSGLSLGFVATLDLVATGQTYRMASESLAASTSGDTISGGIIIKMTAGDTASIALTVTLSVPAATVNVVGGASPIVTYFSGALL